MKLKYIGEGTLSSKGHKFVSGETYELLKDTYEYMLATFNSVFEIIESPKAAPVVEKKTEDEVEPKEEVSKLKTQKTKRTIAPEKE